MLSIIKVDSVVKILMTILYDAAMPRFVLYVHISLLSWRFSMTLRCQGLYNTCVSVSSHDDSLWRCDAKVCTIHVYRSPLMTILYDAAMPRFVWYMRINLLSWWFSMTLRCQGLYDTCVSVSSHDDSLWRCDAKVCTIHVYQSPLMTILYDAAMPRFVWYMCISLLSSRFSMMLRCQCLYDTCVLVSSHGDSLWLCDAKVCMIHVYQSPLITILYDAAMPRFVWYMRISLLSWRFSMTLRCQGLYDTCVSVSSHHDSLWCCDAKVCMIHVYQSPLMTILYDAAMPRFAQYMRISLLSWRFSMTLRCQGLYDTCVSVSSHHDSLWRCDAKVCTIHAYQSPLMTILYDAAMPRFVWYMRISLLSWRFSMTLRCQGLYDTCVLVSSHDDSLWRCDAKVCTIHAYQSPLMTILYDAAMPRFVQYMRISLLLVCNVAKELNT